MKPIQEWLDAYGVSHQNKINKLIHWICVPAIMFSIFGLIMCIPFPFEKSMFLNWGSVALLAVLVFYMRLSFSLFIGFIIIGTLIIWGNFSLLLFFQYSTTQLAIFSIVIFAVAWVFQFIGHHIEGEKPSFLEDLQFLLIGPAWLLHFIYKKLGVPYKKK